MGQGFLKLSTGQNWNDIVPGVNIKSQQALCLRLFFTVAGWWIFDQWAIFVVLCAKSIIQVILMKTDPSHLDVTTDQVFPDHWSWFQTNFQTKGLSNLHHSWLCVCDLIIYCFFLYLWKPSHHLRHIYTHVNPEMVVHNSAKPRLWLTWVQNHILVERAVSYLRARNLVDQCPQCLLLATAISLQS